MRLFRIQTIMALHHFKILAVLALLTATVTVPLHLQKSYKSNHVANVNQVKWKSVNATLTAYLIANNQDSKVHCEVYDGKTASGTKAHVGAVAVDPRIFILGRTTFKIPGYGYGIARDTGGDIKGYHLDLPMTSCKQAQTWGVKHKTIYYKET